MISFMNIQENTLISYNLIKDIETDYVIFRIENMFIDKDQLHAVNLSNDHIFTDYLLNDDYTNQWSIFGESQVDTSLLLAANFQPAMIFHVEKLKHLLKEQNEYTLFDLSLMVLLNQAAILVDGHVVFSFNRKLQPTKQFIQSYGNRLEQLGRYYGNQIKCINNDASTLLSIDTLMNRFNLLNFFISKLKLYPALYRYFMKRKLKPYQHLLQERNIKATKQMIVFLGFDFQYRGNSKYLFEEMIQNNHVTIYFILEDNDPLLYTNNSNYFVPKSQSSKLIEHARVVILESFAPDDFITNGYVFNLWHGTPIKKLFLDSLEPYQNQNIFLYKYRKYNKLMRTDYFLTDHPSADNLFKTAFHLKNTKIIHYGYPRLHYLKAQRLNQQHTIKDTILNKYGLSNDKPILIYLPTWKDYDYEPLEMKQLEQNFHVLSKPHPASNATVNGKIVEEATEDLLVIADIVLTDYSSVIFDSLALNIPSYLLMDDYDAYVATRGVYDSVINDLQPIIYKNRETLIHALIYKPHVAHPSKYMNQTTKNDDLINLIKKRLHT